MNLQILTGDWIEQLRTLPDQSVQCCVTSPPYWGLRDYGVAGQLGLEKTPGEYVEKLVYGFREVQRVLRDDGTLWLNLGDCYATGGGRVGEAPGGGKQGEAWRIRGLITTPNRMPLPGLKSKDLVGIPWRVAFALQADGWYLRSDIIWSKKNPMPESVEDRPTKSHEYIFLLSKQEKYFYDFESIKEPVTASVKANGPNSRMMLERANGKEHIKPNESCSAISKPGNKARDFEGRLNHKAGGIPWEGGKRNKRTVWEVNTTCYKEAHFATFPTDLIKPCIMAGCPVGGTILDPFFGSGTTGQVALELGRKCIGIELNPKYVELAKQRCNVTPGLQLA